RQALTTYASTAAGHWHQAATLLQSLRQSYPTFGAVTPYLTYAQQQAQTEKLPTPQSSTGPLDLLNRPASVGLDVATVAAVGLLVTVIALLAGRRRRRAAARAAARMPVGTPT
ncbi:MAG: hypothetical protein IVW57_02355, partial [Ktedonobacterales bacterium]|nr:hypothetical protein [Ktedonobacterales bacterium]